MTMRLASKARDKAELPEGYQVGDASKRPSCGHCGHLGHGWLRCPILYLAPQGPLPEGWDVIKPWNVIEGDTH